MNKTLVYARTNGEPRVVEISRVDSFLANGYVKDFTKAENLDVELLGRVLRDIERATILSHDIHHVQPIYDGSTRFHYSFLKALQAQARARRIERTREEADKIKMGLGKLRRAIAPDLEYHRYQKLKRKRRVKWASERGFTIGQRRQRS